MHQSPTSYQSKVIKIQALGDLPGGPVVKTNSRGAGSIPGWGAKIPHASWPKNQNIKQKQYCNKFNKDFKNGRKKNPSTRHTKSYTQCFYLLCPMVSIT